MRKTWPAEAKWVLGGEGTGRSLMAYFGGSGIRKAGSADAKCVLSGRGAGTFGLGRSGGITARGGAMGMRTTGFADANCLIEEAGLGTGDLGSSGMITMVFDGRGMATVCAGSRAIGGSGGMTSACVSPPAERGMDKGVSGTRSSRATARGPGLTGIDCPASFPVLRAGVAGAEGNGRCAIRVTVTTKTAAQAR